jgi:hypothetical protein
VVRHHIDSQVEKDSFMFVKTLITGLLVLLLLVGYATIATPARAVGPAIIDPTLKPTSSPSPSVPLLPPDLPPNDPRLLDPFYWLSLVY